MKGFVSRVVTMSIYSLCDALFLSLGKSPIFGKYPKYNFRGAVAKIDQKAALIHLKIVFNL
jgi:hypothetical protein